jgi:EAL and modified HD-GYP domain-containing signal transduction protein
MMELLGADTLTQDACDGAFMVGIFSLLDDMLCMPMEQGLALLSLPEQVVNALRGGDGVYGRMLEIVRACETNDEQAFAAAAIALNYSNRHVNMAHMEALMWADGLGIAA